MRNTHVGVSFAYENVFICDFMHYDVCGATIRSWSKYRKWYLKEGEKYSVQKFCYRISQSNIIWYYAYYWWSKYASCVSYSLKISHCKYSSKPTVKHQSISKLFVTDTNPIKLTEVFKPRVSLKESQRSALLIGYEKVFLAFLW